MTHGLHQGRHPIVRLRGMAVLRVMLTSLILTVDIAAADDAQEAQQLVEKSQLTIESFQKDSNMGAVRDLLRTAKGVFIAPQVLKGAFVLGASGGSGVFLARQEKTNKWSQPAFYTIGGVSFGLQAGGEASEVVLLMMSERGVAGDAGKYVKLGADASIAVGPVGAGAGGATAALSADIISFSRAQGTVWRHFCRWLGHRGPRWVEQRLLWEECHSNRHPCTRDGEQSTRCSADCRCHENPQPSIGLYTDHKAGGQLIGLPLPHETYTRDKKAI